MTENYDTVHLDTAKTLAREPRLLPEGIVREIAATFGVLGDPTRIRILDALSGGELCVCDMATLAGISDAAFAQKITTARTAGS